MRYIILTLFIFGLHGCGTTSQSSLNITEDQSVPQPPKPNDSNKQPPAIPII